MSNLRWIVCERTSHWAAALRTALIRASGSQPPSVLIAEVRNIVQLGGELRRCRCDLALVEVTSKNFETVLAWLAAFAHRGSQLRVVALLDRDLGDVTCGDSQLRKTRRTEIADALREAGAAAVIHSARDLQAARDLGLRTFAQASADASLSDCRPTADQSLQDWARRILPWQDASRPVA
jgi:hypothetical protein